MKKTILLAILSSALLLSACAPNYSEGSRVGVVTKLSYKGLIWKSWEGSLNQGGTRTEYDGEGNSSIVPNAIDFNVSDPAVLAQIKEAAANGRPVELFYTQWFFHPFTISNSHVIVGVKQVN